MPKPMYVWSGTAWVSVATEVESLANFATQSYADSTPGTRLIVPSSVAVGSGSGSVGTNGTVTFSGASSVSLNNVFSSTYDSYRIVLKGTASTVTEKAIYARLRVSGTDTTTNYKSFLHTPFESNYTGGTTANLTSTTYLIVAYRHSTNGSNASSFDLHFPNIATQTIHQGFYNSTGNTTIGNAGYTNGILNDTTQYTGISFIPESGNITGTVSIYGLKN